MHGKRNQTHMTKEINSNIPEIETIVKQRRVERVHVVVFVSRQPLTLTITLAPHTQISFSRITDQHRLRNGIPSPRTKSSRSSTYPRHQRY